MFDALIRVRQGDARADVSSRGAARPLPASFAGHRVLLVEDNEVNQTVGRVMLGRLGLEVSLANNGREALAAIDQACYDLVFMDCQMPEMDGYEATRSLREKERAAGSPRLPVVALTANAMIEDHERCLAAGMDGYLAKPVRLEGLCELLERWLSRSVPSLSAPPAGAHRRLRPLSIRPRSPRCKGVWATRSRRSLPRFSRTLRAG
ncbi:MAG: Sensor histidine kinase RcsC [Chromatiales bacterium USCg_Taylor]|nr:MAG: Sensor histidine kinase RcsC [Chromatiales bacterium USCg_Taylor]